MNGTLPATPIQTSVGNILIADLDKWIYFIVERHAAQMGEILFDFECTDDPEISPFVDGNPRIVIHAPDEGDAVLFIRFQPDGSLILNTESHIEIEQVNGAGHTWHVRDRRIHSAYQPKDDTHG